MTKLQAWIEAVRIRTLPLALSSIILGSSFAFGENDFQWSVLLLAAATTLLSNLANDYGDFKNGKDTENRIGPRRLVQSGVIKPREMQAGIITVVILALITGSLLIIEGTKGQNQNIILFFFILGFGSITAAIKYTVGTKPYGYRGLGDIFVFLFFGLIGVLGSYYLHTGKFNAWLTLPACSIGLLSAGVLNLNNLRDYENDKQTNKRTLVVLMGNDKARYYHLSLIGGAVICGFIYIIFNFHSGFQLLFLVTLPLLIGNIMSVFHNTKPVELYPELKKLAISTLLFSIFFGLGEIL